MTRMERRLVDWVEKHQKMFRLFIAVTYAWLIYDNVTEDDRGLWDNIWLFSILAILGMFAWLWWRTDVIAEFTQHTREAIGSDANLVIITAYQVRTRSIARLNRVMRRYDIMNVPVLDLPPEAKELRQILESLTK